MSEANEIRKKRKKQDAVSIVVILLITLAVIALIVAAFYVKQKRQSVSTVTDETEENVPLTTEVHEVAGYTTPGDLQWTLQTGILTTDWTNASDNDYNMQYTIQSDGEIIYTSVMLSPGDSLTEIQADLPFTEAGEYAVTIEAASYNRETGEFASSVSYSKVLYIKD